MKKIIFAAIILLAVIVQTVNAFDFQQSQDAVTITCTTGKAFFYVRNTESQQLQIAFSANTGQLTGYFDTPIATAQSGQAASTAFYFTAPDDFEGVQDVYITAQACNATSCATKQLTLRVFANACITPIRFQKAPNDNLVLQRPSLYFSSDYYPTSYSALMKIPRSCQKMTVNEFKRIKATIQNTGAAATYDLQLAGETDLTNAELSRTYVTLQRSEEKNFFVDVKPSQSGTFYVTIRAMQNQGIVIENDLCLDVQDDFQATIKTPTLLETKSCEQLQLNATISNQGTTSDLYWLKTSKGELDQEEVWINQGEEKTVSIWLTNLEGTQNVDVSVKSESGLQATSTTKIVATPCSVPVTVAQQPSEQTISIDIQNTLNTPLENVTLELTGIPTTWKYAAENASTIAPNSNKTMTIKLTQTSNEEAPNPAIIVKSNGREIARKQLQAIKPTTGLFTANITENAVLLGLVLVAIAVALWISRKPGKEKELRQRLSIIREKITEEKKE